MVEAGTVPHIGRPRDTQKIKLPLHRRHLTREQGVNLRAAMKALIAHGRSGGRPSMDRYMMSQAILAVIAVINQTKRNY